MFGDARFAAGRRSLRVMLFQRLETMNRSETRHPSDTLRGVRIEGCFNLGGVECAGKVLSRWVWILCSNMGDSCR